MKKQPLLNTYVNNLDMQETILLISRMIEEKKKSFVVAVNVDVIMKIESDNILKRIVDNADIVIVDTVCNSHFSRFPVISSFFKS